MKRGVINLQNIELQYLENLISSEPSSSSLRSSKFSTSKPNKNENENINIQVSIEEVEMLLDNLPMPQDNESEVVNTLRKKLQQFITNQR